jgi:nicotinamidase-related amidase
VLQSAADAALLLVDIQQRLMPAIDDGAAVVANAVRLAEAARLLEVPTCATEQYPDGLGHTVPELAGHPQLVMAKTAFSAVADPGFATLLPPRTSEIVLAGAETHVCVLQTALDLVRSGREVYVAVDCVASRRALDRDTALARMRGEGVRVVTREMVAFEWLGEGGTDRFRAICREFLR